MFSAPPTPQHLPVPHYLLSAPQPLAASARAIYFFFVSYDAQMIIKPLTLSL